MGRANVPHRARPRHVAGEPVLVTLRALIRALRSDVVFSVMCRAFAQAGARSPARFRIVHFSLQRDHVHLIVEASDERALTSGMRSLAIRIARSINTLLSRRGRFWGDRWHGRALRSPREVRNALVYVLANFRKHARERLPPGVDAFSSAFAFDGWRVGEGAELPRAGPPFHRATTASVVVSRAKTWLGAVGWRRHGLIGVEECPVRG
jgi:REP element-mobilizing transposase RayT